MAAAICFKSLRMTGTDALFTKLGFFVAVGNDASISSYVIALLRMIASFLACTRAAVSVVCYSVTKACCWGSFGVPKYASSLLLSAVSAVFIMKPNCFITFVPPTVRSPEDL